MRNVTFLIGYTVIGSNVYLGRTDPFTISPDKYRRQRVLVYWKATESTKPTSVLFRPCPRRGCHHRQHRYLALCFHKDCHNLLQWGFRVQNGQNSFPAMVDIWSLGRSTLWLSGPVPAKRYQERRTSLVRAGFSANTLSDFLRERTTSPKQVCSANRMTVELYSLFSELPPELQDNIIINTWSCSFFSTIVVLYESRVLIENLRLLTALRDRYTRPINLDLAEVVFLGMSTVGNSQYVSYLSHQCLSPHDKPAFRNFDTFRIRLSMDDVGIRDIEFLSHDKSFLSDYAPTPNSSLWYKTIRPHDHRTISRIEGFSDVCYSSLPHNALALTLLQDLLLRDVSIGQKPFLDPAFKDIVEWNVPEAPEIDPKNCYHTSYSTGNGGPLRMRWIPLGRGLSGIVAAHGFQGMLTLHAWYDGSDSKSIYNDHPYITEDAQWLFFPIGVEEYVSEVWIRQSPYETAPSPVIFVKDQAT